MLEHWYLLPVVVVVVGGLILVGVRLLRRIGHSIPK